MVTASSTVREIRDAVSDWKDENVVAESNVSDTDTETDNKEDCSTSNTLNVVLEMVDKLEMDELIALMEYIEKRL